MYSHKYITYLFQSTTRQVRSIMHANIGSLHQQHAIQDGEDVPGNVPQTEHSGLHVSYSYMSTEPFDVKNCRLILCPIQQEKFGIEETSQS